MDGNLLLHRPQTGSRTELIEFIAQYEPLEASDRGVAMELELARVQLDLLDQRAARAASRAAASAQNSR